MNSDGTPRAGAAIDLAAVRERLAGKRGRAYWRSLDELAGTAEFQDWLHREFPRQASEWVESPDDGVSRRRFLQLASASLALAGLSGCTKQPLERIVPYVRQPEEIVPGRPLYFATTFTHAGYGLGVLAESHMGRPTKVEGNPDHPASLGATDAFAQASVLSLYDPERSQSLTELGRIRTWGGFVNEVAGGIRALRGLGGEGLRILTGAVTSPTLAAQMQALSEQFPRARWHRWEPAGDHAARQAATAAFGAPLDAVYDFTRARVVVTLESDVLGHGPGAVRYSRDFARNRRPRAGRPEMNRLYAVESSPTMTSSLADHRLPLAPEELEAFALALAATLGAAAETPAALGAASGTPALPEKARAWVAAVARDLRAHADASLVVAGPYASPAVQVLAHAINGALGNAGRTVSYIPAVEADPVDHLASLSELVRDLNAGRVEMLVIAGTNPVYTAPADLGFADALLKARLRVHHGLYQDETAQLCQWHVPATHELEGWSDARAFDGTASLIQPLIDPLYHGKSLHELVAVFFDRIDASAYEIVRELWAHQPALGGDFERAWRRALHDGVIPGTAAAPVPAAVSPGAVAQAVAAIRGAVTGRAGGGDDRLTLLFRPDPTIDDGRYAPNTWLQELPKPLTKLTWDNALIVSPATAERLGLRTEDVVEISAGGRRLSAAVWMQPGHGDRSATLHLGYGRPNAGASGSGLGFNAYTLRTSRALWTAPGAVLAATGDTYRLASTQNHHLLENAMEEIPEAMREAELRKPVRTGTLAEFRANPRFAQHAAHSEPTAVDEVPGEPRGEGAQKDPEAEGRQTLSLYPEYDYSGYKWGMAIDLNVCTGCSACVVACQAENNIPVVGKEQVLRGREMHWLRIDRYFEGDLDDPVIHHQPLPCMHCEKAPCEVVCPVAATAHSAEGLNDMAYNRCVGTRYCANNCPYKVRRFNFLRYSNKDVPVLKLLQNPDVTVRMRGVMEKCTYCVQRINKGRIDAEVEGRRVRPGEVQTACQQACPTEAIVFGDLNDREWEVTRRQSDPLNYGLLEELGTQPRTTYLAKLRNVNPELPAADRS